MTNGDVDILKAAGIAEALAVTTYTTIVQNSGWFTRIPDDDQGYLYAARQEEMSHYLLVTGATGSGSPFTTFYYPKNMLHLLGSAPRVVSTIHNIYEGGLPRTLAYSLTDGLTVHTTAVSKAVAKRSISAGAVTPRKCSVVTNGIDTVEFAPNFERRSAMFRATKGARP